MDRSLASRNRKPMLTCVTVVAGMAGLSAAAVPLYYLFTSVTGFAGTVRTAAKSNGTVLDRAMRIRFDASTNSALPWQFKAVQHEISVKVGETATAFYRAHNADDKPAAGWATFNVTPYKAGKYFNKIECFCFTEQRLDPGESIDMPVRFFIDPEIDNDPNLAEVKTITPSYTFFRVKQDEAEKKTALMASPVLNSIH